MRITSRQEATTTYDESTNPGNGWRSPEPVGGGYENAPATRMLATQCACCRRPLVDAVSVDTGVGPECRKKYGFNQEASPEARAEANQIVYRIALEGGGLEVAKACARLRELGFDKLAAVVEKRACPIRIEEQGNCYAVASPYSERFVELSRRIAGRRWHKEQKVTTFPVAYKRALFDALVQAYRGLVAMGPKGPFVLGGAS